MEDLLPQHHIAVQVTDKVFLIPFVALRKENSHQLQVIHILNNLLELVNLMRLHG